MQSPLEELRATNEELMALLVTMLWADDRMAHAQVSAVGSAATLIGFDEAAARIARGPVPYDPLPLQQVSLEARHMVFATAVWVAAADRRFHPREDRLLGALRRELDLDTDTSSKLTQHARRIRSSSLLSPTPTELSLVLRVATRSVENVA